MTPEDADKEGGYSLEEFREIWAEINGEWDPGLVVDVVEFEYVGLCRPEHQEKLRADGGTPAEDTCHICGTPSSETNLGWSEEREDHVCVGCVVHLQENGHYPDQDGPKQETTVEYEITGGLGS